MNIYKVERKDGADYDEQSGVVVWARDEKAARRTASMTAGDEGALMWRESTEFVRVTLLASGVERSRGGLIMRDSRSG